MLLKCLPTQEVGCTIYSLCTCRSVASGILMGSTWVGICQCEIFFTIYVVLTTSVTLAPLCRRILSTCQWLLSLCWDSRHWKSESLSLLSIVTLREQGLLPPLKSLNRQTLDFQVKVKWVYSHEKIKKADIQKLHLLKIPDIFLCVSRNFLYFCLCPSRCTQVKLISKIICFVLENESHSSILVDNLPLHFWEIEALVFALGKTCLYRHLVTFYCDSGSPANWPLVTV